MMLSMTLIAVLAAEPAITGAPAAGATATLGNLPDQIWAGHLVVWGQRVLPLFGRIEPRNDTWVLATVQQEGASLFLDQRPCRSAFAPIAGATVEMAPGATEKLPGARIEMKKGEGDAVSGVWTVGWGEEDIDADGHPGLSIYVDAPLCGGVLYVASTVHNRAVASVGNSARPGESLTGLVETDIEQRILGASNGCLRVVARDSVDRMRGVMSYVRVPDGTTCDTVGAGWPIAAGGNTGSP